MDIKRAANILKALSHPNRLELFLEIAEKQEKDYETDGCMINDIIKKCKVGAPTVSHHLKELAAAELIITERKGKFLVARVNRNVLSEIGILFGDK